MEHLKVKIGDLLYPYDNSYSYKVGDKNKKTVRLAGDVNTSRCLVKVVSEPFEKTWKHWFTKQTMTREFVEVEYNNERYVILNRFTNHRTEGKESTLRFLNQFD